MEDQADPHAISEYLAWALSADVKLVSQRPLAGGVHQNVAITALVDGRTQQFVLRPAPSPDAHGFAREVAPYDLAVEFGVLRNLEKVALLTPRVWGLDQEGRFVGRVMFLMEFIPGCTVAEAVEQDASWVDRLAETIWRMNQIRPEQVPSLVAARGGPAKASIDLVGWVAGMLAEMDPPALVSRGVDLARKSDPPGRPLPAFSNGDLGPWNFICAAEGEIAVVDWEYAGFVDPLNELMMLHAWPTEAPFLSRHPLDKAYCRLAGVNAEVLSWYELIAAVCQWTYAARDANADQMAAAMRRLTLCMAK